MSRKAVFLDLDGTYANERGTVPDSAREAVVQARANGHLVFLARGESKPCSARTSSRPDSTA